MSMKNRKNYINFNKIILRYVKMFLWILVVGIPGIEPGSLAALVFELLDDTYA